MDLSNQITNVIPQRESLIFEVLAQDYANPLQVMEGLEQELLHYAVKRADDEKQYTAAYQKHAETLEAYHAAKKCNEQFELLEQRNIALETLKEEASSIQLKEKQIADAERASIIHEIESQFRLLDEEKKLKEIEFHKATNAVQELRKRLEERDSAYKQEEGKEQERAKVAEQLIRLRDHLPAVMDLATKEANVLKLKEKIGKMEGEYSTVAEKAEMEKKKLADLNVKIEKLEQAITPYEELFEKLNTIRAHYKVVRDYENLKKESSFG